MDAAVAALIGAGIGAVVPAATTYALSRRDADRAERDRQETRHARLFNHRREACLTFISECNAMAERLYDHYNLIGGDAPVEVLESLRDRAALVQLYGTSQTHRLAKDAYDALVQLLRGGAKADGAELGISETVWVGQSTSSRTRRRRT